MAPAITGLGLIGFSKRKTYERGSFWRGDNPLILPLSTPSASRDVLKQNTFVRQLKLYAYGVKPAMMANGCCSLHHCPIPLYEAA